MQLPYLMMQIIMVIMVKRRGMFWRNCAYRQLLLEIREIFAYISKSKTSLKTVLSSYWSIHAGNIIYHMEKYEVFCSTYKANCIKMQVQQAYNMGNLVSFGKLFIYTAHEGTTSCFLDGFFFIGLCYSTHLYKPFYVIPFFRRQILLNSVFTLEKNRLVWFCCCTNSLTM